MFVLLTFHSLAIREYKEHVPGISVFEEDVAVVDSLLSPMVKKESSEAKEAAFAALLADKVPI